MREAPVSSSALASVVRMAGTHHRHGTYRRTGVQIGLPESALAVPLNCRAGEEEDPEERGHVGGCERDMPLEERIVAWSRQRPRWQQIVLRGVADGRPPSEDALDELIDAVVEERCLEGGELEMGHLVAGPADAPPVSLESLAEPAHVNALSTTVPLTFAEGGITIVYGDNGSGKSGYARLLKRIARSRHDETVLTDVFRDTSGHEPTAKLGVRIGDEVQEVSWPKSKRPELQRMLFYDSACGNTYIADEADFPYRPYALFVMDGLIAACGRIRALTDTKLYENTRRARRIPRATEETSETEVGRFLAGLHAGSSVQKLDALLGKLDEPGMYMAAVEAEEGALRSSDTREARRNLERTAERLDALGDHIESVDSVLGPEAVEEVDRARDELRQMEQAAEQHAESLRSEGLLGVGGEAWKVLWDSAKRFSESHAYADQQFPVAGGDSRCVLCLQQLGESGSGVLARLDQFVKDDIQVRRGEARSKHAALLERMRSLEVFGGAVDSHLRDLEASHPEDVGAIRTLLERYEGAQRAADTTASSAGPGGVEAPEAGDMVGRLRKVAVESLRLADDLDDPGADRTPSGRGGGEATRDRAAGRGEGRAEGDRRRDGAAGGEETPREIKASGEHGSDHQEDTGVVGGDHHGNGQGSLHSGDGSPRPGPCDDRED